MDPWVDAERVEREYGIQIKKSLSENDMFDAAVLAVGHSEFRGIDIRRFVPLPGVVYDVKGFLPRELVTARL